MEYEKDFTIFTPTRGRAKLLVDCIHSFWQNTNNLDRIEFCFYCDSEDSETLDCYENYLKKLPLDIRIYVGPRPSSLNAANNLLASQATGRYLQNINDDLLLTTKSWDTIALRRIEEFKRDNNIKDDIIYGKTQCNSIDHSSEIEYSSFPLVSLEAFKTVGFLMPETFRGLGADNYIYRIYNEINRVVDLSEIKMRHILHETLEQVMNPDETAARMRANSWANPVDPQTLSIEKEVNKLKEFIESQK